jgi:hypothetical protein
MLTQERVDMVLIEELRALGLRCDKVEKEACSDPRIERNPIVASVSSWPSALGRIEAYQTRINSVHDSTSSAQASTTQYMSHGVRSAGSEVLRAL